MAKDYTLNTYADGFGVWHCEIFFTIPLGNSGEAERVLNNALAAAKRRIRDEITDRNLTNFVESGQNRTIKRLAYEVKSNKLELGSSRLMMLTIAEK